MTVSQERDGRRSNAASGIAGGLKLAAAPIFAAMALVQAASGWSPMGLACVTGSRASPLTGMAVMYLLMSLFHLAPWVRLLVNPRKEG